MLDKFRDGIFAQKPKKKKSEVKEEDRDSDGEMVLDGLGIIGLDKQKLSP